MKHPPVAKEPHAYPRTLRLGNLRPKFPEQGFDITPADAAAYRVPEQQLESFSVSGFHEKIISSFDIMSRNEPNVHP